jgi:RHS repeat-associated protein
VWEGYSIAQIRDYDASDTLTGVRHVFGEGEVRTTSLAQSLATGTSLLHLRDHLGTVRELVNTSDLDMRARYDFDPYGKRTKLAGDLDCEFGFTGHYEHASGITLAPFRAYHSSLGRWLSRDPIEEEGGLNLYGYLENKPSEAVDPLGFRSCTDLKRMLARQLQNYLGATRDANDEQATLTRATNANALQRSLLSGSTILSGGAAVLGGVPLIGFAGYGSSAAVVGSGTSVVMTGSAGPGLVLTRYGPTLGNSAVRTGAVTGTAMAVRAAEKYFDPRVDNRANDASAALAGALDARQAALYTIRLIQQKLKECGCR